MEGKIEEVIIDTIEEIKKENPDAEIDKIQSLVLEKIKENLRDKLELDLYETPDEVLWAEIEKDVQEKLGIFEELDDEIENEGKLDTIADFEKEIQRINKLEEKGKSKQATAASGRIIRKIKDEIKKIKNAEEANSSDLDYLEKLEIALDEQLEWHKNQLSNRYKKEFSQKPATVKAIVTVLPKGIGIQAKKVVNCINQLKEAKTNKERIFKIIELGKEIGVLALTPVTFTVRFIVKHWYLLLLLLLLLRLPGFNFGKNPSEEQQPELQPQPEPSYSTEYEPGYEHGLEPGIEPVKAPVPNVVTSSDLSPDTLRQEHIELAKKQAQERAQEIAGERAAEAQRAHAEEVARGVSTDSIREEHIELAKKQAQERAQEIAAKRAAEGVQPDAVQEIANSMTEEEKSMLEELTQRFMNGLEEEHRFFIATRHPDVIIVHDAESYVEAVSKINPLIKLNPAGAEDHYLKTISTLLRPFERPIIWPDIDTDCKFFNTEADLAQYITNNQEPALSSYYNEFIANGGNKSILDELKGLFDFSSSPELEVIPSVGMNPNISELYLVILAAGILLSGPTGGLSLALAGL